MTADLLGETGRGGQRVDLTPRLRALGLGFRLRLPAALALSIARLLPLEPGERAALLTGSANLA
jgi:hypothetical protein